MIKYENIEIKYGDFVAIDNLNLDIREGEFFTFLGPSGCGKTTSLRALVGFLTPSKGKVYVGDKDVTNLPVEKRNIGMVFQSYALFPTMTVYDNIAFGMKVKKLTREEIDRKVHEVAAKIKITEEQLRKNVADLSGGQQQRVALARAIVLEPKILCLDEPLSNLDAKLRIDMRMELKRLQKELGITTLYVTHDQEEALTLSDRIAVFNNGYVEQVGTPYEIYNESKSEFVCDFIGDINRMQKELLEEIKAEGVEIAHVTLHVGLGTFRPVKADDILDHHMHSEFYRIEASEAEKINRAKESGHRVICVGTTSCRTVESAADENGHLEAKSGWTQIFIYPGYKFKVLDCLITNFHLPESTLIMLVSALAGREHVLAAYEEAVKERYRFFSFGDAMFIQ